MSLPPVELDSSTDTVEIVVGEGDHTSGIVDQLHARDSLRVRIESLDTADYVLSERVAVKRMHLHHPSAMTDEKVEALIDQLTALTEVYSRSVLVLEPI